MNEYINDKKNINRTALAFLAMLILVEMSSAYIPLAIYYIFPSISSVGLEAVSYGSLILMLPLFYALTYFIPRGVITERQHMSVGTIFAVLAIGLGVSYALNYAMTPVENLISTIKSAFNVTPSLAYYDDLTLPSILYTVIGAPVIEELIFRKIMLDRLRPAGDSVAILFTALAFGIYHMNISQLGFAVWWGIILGYVAVKTGGVRYTLILHMIVNSLSVLWTFFYNSDKYTTSAIVSSAFTFVMFVAGMILLIRAFRHDRINLSGPKLCGVHKSLFATPGTILVIIAALIITSYNTILS